MSDRPEESRSTSEVAGGWFVPKNAMTPQQAAASSGATGPTSAVPIPGSTPQQDGAWYVPEEAAQRVAALATTGESGSGPAAEQPAAAGGKSVQTPLPQGAGVSTEVDYDNYVPGVGFVPRTETTSVASAESAIPATGTQPAAEPAVQPAQQAAGQPAAAQTVETDEYGQPVGLANAAPVVDQPVAQASPAAAVQTEQPAASDAGASGASASVNPALVQRFTEVEQSVQVLRRRYTAGTLTKSQLQDELRKLMILDDEGYWWMIGLESDRWYKYNGKDWIAANPPGRTSDGAIPPGAAQSADAVAQGATAGSSGFPQNRLDIPLDEYGMPLPQRVPVTDPGATMVGAAAPRLDNTLRAPDTVIRSAGPRVSKQEGFAPNDFGVTVPSAAVQVTQPGLAVRSAAAQDAAVIPSPATGVDDGGASAQLQPGYQPDYGLRPKSIVTDRHRMAGCLIRAAIVSVFLALAGSLIAIVAAVLGYYSIIQRYDQGIANLGNAVQNASESARILDMNGRVLYQVNDPNLGARIKVPLNQVSPFMIAATVRTEDQRFYTNPGFDPIGIVRAVLQNLTAGGTVSGASSITQQLTRALVLDPGAAQDRSSGRKITEIIVSSEIARRYTKSQILEFYFNTTYYGNLAYGVESAAQTYFGKSAKDLNLAESAFLAGLVQSPATYDPVLHREAAIARMKDILGLMSSLGCLQMEHAPYNTTPLCITQADINQASVQIAQVQARKFSAPTNTAIYPHFVNYVEQQLEAQFGKDAVYGSGFTVYTTIDPKIQDLADQAVKQQIAALAGRNVTNGAVLAVRPSDGAIVAMVGSADFNNKEWGQFNVTLAPRQPGSSIKPFIYLAALERDANNNYWTPSTILWDVPSCFGSTQNPYCPTNYDHQSHGPQSVRFALANSYNIPAVKTLQYVGIERFKQMADRVGLTFPLSTPDQAGLASALGGVEVPMIDLVRAYTVLANNGQKIDFFAISKVTRKSGDQDQVIFEAKDHPTQQVVEPGLAYLVTSILSDNQARLPAFGAGNQLQLRDGRPAAVKTGTTNDSKDNWTIGYTPQLVVGVWVGNSNNTAMQGTSGVTGAAPIWNAVMSGALAGQPIQQFQPPSTDQQVNVCADFGTQDFPECQNHRTDWIFSANPVPAKDALFQTFNVDTFSGLKANENCPDYQQVKTFLVVNDPTAIAWLNNDPKGQDWAKAHNMDLPVTPPPTQSCDANTPRPQLNVSSPQPNNEVRGLLEIRGSVFVPAFHHYQIEIGAGSNATQFNIVDGPTTAQPSDQNSFLGRWDTTTVPNGLYTLRLSAFDNQNHHAEVTIPLLVNNLAPTQIPTQAPVVVATTAPITGQTTDQNGQPIAPTAQPGQTTDNNPTPIIIESNPPTPTMKPVFPPTTAP